MRWLWLFLLFIPALAFAAPSDDGQTAGSRMWILFQARSVKTVTPADGADISPSPARGFIGQIASPATVCAVAVRGIDDAATATTLLVANGAITWIEISRVLSTGTTCTVVSVVY
jgi:hypothetical protein